MQLAMDNIFVQKAELTGAVSSIYSFVMMMNFGELTNTIIQLTAWVSFFIAIMSALVMIEKYTDIDIPLINIKDKKTK